MEMLQVHARALKDGSAAYHEFLLHYKANARVVYGIVEGKDDPMFYTGLIERQLSDGWEVRLVPAGCKENVLSALRMFDWTRFPRKRVCFFADRDLSDFLQEVSVKADNLYVTDNYSIENDAVNFHTFKRLLVEVMNISDLRPDEIEKVEKCFWEALAVFYDTMMPIMAQIIIWRRNGLQPQLNDMKLKEIFVFVNGAVQVNSSYDTVALRLQQAARCLKVLPSSLDEVSGVTGELRQRGGEKFIRGKYFLWFMVELALEIHRSITNICPRFTTTPKVRVSIGVANAMVVVAPRVRCPTSLQSFLNRTYDAFIKDFPNGEGFADAVSSSNGG